MAYIHQWGYNLWQTQYVTLKLFSPNLKRHFSVKSQENNNHDIGFFVIKALINIHMFLYILEIGKVTKSENLQ